MKFLYIILFFIDVLALAAQSFLLLRVLDRNENNQVLAALIFGVFVCILLLVYFLNRYLRIPADKSPK